MSRHRLPRPRYEDIVLATKPVLYVPIQGGRPMELVRAGVVTNTGSVAIAQPGPFRGASAARFSASAADHDRLTVATDTSYHPGDTFSVGGWFNRLGVGDVAGPALVHLGTGDFVVWFDTTDKFTLRKAGTANVFATTQTFSSPYTTGWTFGVYTKATTTTIAYINGAVAAGSGSNQTIVGSSTDPGLGSNPSGGGNDFDGSMAHWGIWNRALSANEILELYRAGINAT